MEKSVRKISFTIFLLVFINVKGDEVFNVPLIDKLEAPIKAELDISTLSEQIKALVEHEVQNEVERRMKSLIDGGFERINKTINTARRTFQSEINNTVDFIQKQKKEMGSLTKQVAFHAVLQNDLVLGDQQTAVFDSVFVNRGNGYNRHTGYFTAPVDGLYHFASSFMARGSRGLHFKLQVNENVIARGFAGAPSAEAGSILATAELKKGDIVGIKRYGRVTQTMHRLSSSFTGFKV